MTTDAHRMSWLQRLLVALALRPFKVTLRRQFGARPNDRDEAEAFCEKRIRPALKRHREVVLDFKDTGLVTQSFIHALISEAVKEDPRWAAKIRTANASAAQQAVYDLALRHMLKPAPAPEPLRLQRGELVALYVKARDEAISNNVVPEAAHEVGLFAVYLRGKAKGSEVRAALAGSPAGDPGP